MKTKKGLTKILVIAGIILGIFVIASTIEYTKLKNSGNRGATSALTKVVSF
jgi:hypothetical protein